MKEDIHNKYPGAIDNEKDLKRGIGMAKFPVQQSMCFQRTKINKI